MPERVPSRDPAYDLAAHVWRARFEDLPAASIRAATNDIVDTLGCMLGGSGAAGIGELMQVLADWGGQEESRVLLHGRSLPAHHAAMMNAAMGHALDFDDTLDHGGSIHPGVSVLASGLAMADRLGGVPGRDLVLAVALGLDVSCRVALAATVDRGWHRTAAMGVFGAAATAGKLLDLDQDQTLNALGIAYSQAAGNRQCIIDGSLTKRLQAGQAAASGVFAAVLAQQGFTGAHEIFAGRYGFYELYQPGGYDLGQLTEALGIKFRGDELSFKPYPCGRPQHATLDVAVALREELGLHAGNIASAMLSLDAATYADQFTSGPHKRRPEHVVHAQFALPFLVAVALLRGRVGIDDITRIDAPDVLDLAARIEGSPEDGKPKGWARLSVTSTDGRTMALESTDPLGSPQRPLTTEQIGTKFRDCARHAVREIPEERIERLLRDLMRLTELPSTTALTHVLA